MTSALLPEIEADLIAILCDMADGLEVLAQDEADIHGEGTEDQASLDENAATIRQAAAELSAHAEALAAKDAEIASEREARNKLEAAYRMKDEAVNTLMKRLQKLGDYCEDLIP